MDQIDLKTVYRFKMRTGRLTDKIMNGRMAHVIEAKRHAFNTIIAKDIQIQNIPAPEQVPISTLAHGLDRVLFK